jgi:hypothetical protein
MQVRMGLFGKRAVECDWCGAPIQGDGIEDAGLRLCSQACVDLKNAPQVTDAARTVPDLRLPSASLAASELAIAIAQLELYQRIAGDAEFDEDDEEDDFMRAQQAYFGIWDHLETVRAHLTTRGAELGAYDDHRRQFLAASDSFDTQSVHRFGGGRRELGVATFQPENIEHARAAIEALQRALAKLGES